MAERIELVFDLETTLSLSHILLEGNSAVCRNKGTSLSNIVPNSGLWKFSNCTSTITSVVNLGGRSMW